MTKSNLYNQVIKTLMINDHNATWNDILEESDNNINIAYNTLTNDLKQAIEENDDIEIKNFYKEVLDMLL